MTRAKRPHVRLPTPKGHKCVYGLRRELIARRDPAPDWARFLVPCAQGVMAFEGEDDAAVYRALQADTKY